MYEMITDLAKKNLKALNLKCQGKVSEYAFAVADIRHDLASNPIKGVDRDAVSKSAKEAMGMTAIGLSLKSGVANVENLALLKMQDELFDATAEKSLYPSDACADYLQEKFPALWAQYEATLNSALQNSNATSVHDVKQTVHALEKFYAEQLAREEKAKKSEESQPKTAKEKAALLAKQTA